jgi:hypothetical protein
MMLMDEKENEPMSSDRFTRRRRRTSCHARKDHSLNLERSFVDFSMIDANVALFDSAKTRAAITGECRQSSG